AEGEERLRALLPDAEVSADTLHFRSGSNPGAVLSMSAAGAVPHIRTPVGMIDGAPSKHVATSALRGFAEGAPVPDDHGSAVGSLLRGAGVGDIRAADVFGSDAAGGNALAIARALGWLAAGGAKVV